MWLISKMYKEKKRKTLCCRKCSRNSPQSLNHSKLTLCHYHGTSQWMCLFVLQSGSLSAQCRSWCWWSHVWKPTRCWRDGSLTSSVTSRPRRAGQLLYCPQLYIYIYFTFYFLSTNPTCSLMILVDTFPAVESSLSAVLVVVHKRMLCLLFSLLVFLLFLAHGELASEVHIAISCIRVCTFCTF